MASERVVIGRDMKGGSRLPTSILYMYIVKGIIWPLSVGLNLWMFILGNGWALDSERGCGRNNSLGFQRQYRDVGMDVSYWWMEMEYLYNVLGVGNIRVTAAHAVWNRSGYVNRCFDGGLMA